MTDPHRPLDYATPQPPRRTRLWVVFVIVAALLVAGLLVLLLLGMITARPVIR